MLRKSDKAVPMTWRFIYTNMQAWFDIEDELKRDHLQSDRPIDRARSVADHLYNNARHLQGLTTEEKE